MKDGSIDLNNAKRVYAFGTAPMSAQTLTANLPSTLPSGNKCK